jgi:hypothetical protein
MGLLDSIKQDARKSGQSKGKFIYFREGQKVRIRFLQDMDDGLELLFHDSFERSINVPCQELFGRDCPYCNDESVRTRKQYCWSVWDYENKEVKLFMFPVNNCTPIPALVAMYENYGTITDRDYVISVSGKQQNKTFSVVPMDKVKFRNDKAKAYSEKAVLQLLDKAFPCDATSDSDIDDEDEEEEKPKKKKKPTSESKKPNTKGKAKDEDDDDDYENIPEDIEDDIPFDEDDEDDGEDTDYEDMSVKELYKLCKKRKIDVEPKKSQRYYIKKLEDADQAEDDWEDEEDDDDWEDDDE